MRFGHCYRVGIFIRNDISKRGILKAVCDIDIEKSNTLANKYCSKAYYEIDDMLMQENDLDVIAICSPNGLHAKHSILCLNSGVNVDGGIKNIPAPPSEILGAACFLNVLMIRVT